MNVATWLLGATAAAAAVFSGAMFVFSAFVLPALSDLVPRDAVGAMQAINVRAPNSPLVLPMGGAVLGSAAVIAMAFVGDGSDLTLRTVGALLVLASIVITGVGNVPLNNRLATLDAQVATPASWRAFNRPWLAWNAARVLTSLAGGVLLAIAAARA